MNIKKLNDKAVIPSKGSIEAAGYDLYSIESYALKPRERKAFKTGISLAIPKGLYGRIAPRSGLAVNYGIDVMAGVIDSDFRGEILVTLINLGDTKIQLPLIKDGKEAAIAQIIFEPYTEHDFNLVQDLNETVRGVNGFGSTDNKNDNKNGNKSVNSLNIPDAVKSALAEIYNKNPVELNNKTRYIDNIKERDKNINNK